MHSHTTLQFTQESLIVSIESPGMRELTAQLCDLVPGWRDDRVALARWEISTPVLILLVSCKVSVNVPLTRERGCGCCCIGCCLDPGSFDCGRFGRSDFLGSGFGCGGHWIINMHIHLYYLDVIDCRLNRVISCLLSGSVCKIWVNWWVRCSPNV